MGQGRGGDNRASLRAHFGCEADRRRHLQCRGRAGPHNLPRRHNGRGEYAAMSEHRTTDAEYAAALAAGRTEAESEIRAEAVRYVPDRDAIEIATTRNAGFLVPRQWIGALQDVSVEDLAKLEVWPDGSAIEIEDRDIQISVHGLMTAILWAAPSASAARSCRPPSATPPGSMIRASAPLFPIATS